jgi:N utilization substance protein B
MMRPRSRARETALKYLYEYDVHRSRDVDPPGIYMEREAVEEGVRPYALVLVESVLERLGTLDEAIQSAAENWRVDRMAVIDRNVLRLGAWEILHSPDVPGEVAIDEGVTLAKRYGSEKSGAFVNGILDRIRIGATGGRENEHV